MKTQMETLVVIGGGAMARAIIEGAASAESARPARFVVCEPDAGRRAIFERPDAFGGRIMATAARVEDLGPHLESAAPLLLAVKPQVFPDVASTLAPLMGGEGRVVISILAGTRSARIREALGGGARVVRVMPNTPARIGEGMSAVALGAGTQPGDEALAMSLFDACGEVVRIDESLMDAYTALAGSGPAYVFYLAEAMAKAGVEMGFDEQTADRIVRQTIRGAGMLLASSEESASELRAAVTSKRGTTEAATNSMDESGVMESIVHAALAARDRGAELGR
ncbi:MAG: pyrroline-5-carboxylate reductase [Phycisphaeraceae bacterium]|nr:MAG: pyrroline-5-carboxylate reductase [Phycisphaeraceae bacterium]